MGTDPTENPWERLREKAREPDGRMVGDGSSLLGPDGAQRLYSAAAVVLASIRELVIVAEDLVQQRLDASAETQTPSSHHNVDPPEPRDRFRSVRVHDTRGGVADREAVD